MSIFKREKRSKYAKIPKKHKILFLKKVLQQKQPLKSTADLFKINYSTAKTLIRQYRSQSLELDITECSSEQSNDFFQNSKGMRRCSFKQLNVDHKQSGPNFISFYAEEERKNRRNKDDKIGYIVAFPEKKYLDLKQSIFERVVMISTQLKKHMWQNIKEKFVLWLTVMNKAWVKNILIVRTYLNVGGDDSWGNGGKDELRRFITKERVGIIFQNEIRYQTKDS